MTKKDAIEAMKTRATVCAGKGNDYDEGWIIAVGPDSRLDEHDCNKAGFAFVGWNFSTFRTWTPLRDISIAK